MLVFVEAGSDLFWLCIFYFVIFLLVGLSGLFCFVFTLLREKFVEKFCRARWSGERLITYDFWMRNARGWLDALMLCSDAMR